MVKMWYTLSVSYNSEFVKARRRRLKELTIAYMGGKCLKCSFDGHPASFNAHHVDPTKKEIRVGSGDTYSWQKLKTELNKCMLLCANCHSEVHATNEPFFFNEENIPDYGVIGVDHEPITEHRGGHEIKPRPKCLDCDVKIGMKSVRCRPCSQLFRKTQSVDNGSEACYTKDTSSVV